MPNSLPSLDYLCQRVERERDQLQRHADALDSKAGLTLGFAGVIAALANASGDLRMRYLTKPTLETRNRVLDTDIVMHARDSKAIRRKSQLLTLAISALVGAILLVAAGIVV